LNETSTETSLNGRQGQIWTYIYYRTHFFPDRVTDELTGTYINGPSRSVQRNKKLDPSPRWLDNPGYSSLRRRFSHADRENPRIPTSPIHSDTAAPGDELTTDLYFGCETDEGVFFPNRCGLSHR
jgi:hypothetical protein